MEYTRSQKELVKKFIKYRLVILEFEGGYQTDKYYLFRFAIADKEYFFEHKRNATNRYPVSFYIDKEIERIKEINQIQRIKKDWMVASKVAGQATVPGRD